MGRSTEMSPCAGGVRVGVLVVGSDAVRSPVGSTVLALLVVLGPVEEVHSKLTV